MIGETLNHKTIKDPIRPRKGISRCWTVKMKRFQFSSSLVLFGLAVCLVPQWGLVASKAVSQSESEAMQAQEAHPEAYRSSKAKVGLAKAAINVPAEAKATDADSASAPKVRKTRSPIEGSFEDIGFDDNSEFNPAGELGQVSPPRSVFASSFALHRIKPLEFKDVHKTANGVPIFHPEEQEPIQKRGGSAGYGGVYSPDHLGGDDEGQVGHTDYGSYDDYNNDYSSGGAGGSHGRGSGEVDYSNDYGSDYGGNDYNEGEGRGEHNPGHGGFQGEHGEHGEFGHGGGFEGGHEGGHHGGHGGGGHDGRHGGHSGHNSEHGFGPGGPRGQGGSGGHGGGGPSGPADFVNDYSEYGQSDNGVFGPSDYGNAGGAGGAGGSGGFSGEYFDY